MQLHVSKVEESRSLDIHYMIVCYTCCCGALLRTAVPMVCVCWFLCAPLWAGRVCCCCVFFPFILDIKFSLDVPAGVTQKEGHTGFFIHLLSAVRALIFLARRIQPFLSLVDREAEFGVLTI